MKKEYALANIDVVAEHCPFIKNTLMAGGANLVGDPQWHLAISLACHTDNPSETARRLCESSPHCTPEGNADKLATAQQARIDRPEIGPPKCATIAIEREECKTCPHRNEGTTPISIPFKLTPPGFILGGTPTNGGMGKSYATIQASLLANPSTAKLAATANDRTLRKLYNNAVAGGVIWSKSPHATAKLFQNNLANPLIHYQAKFYEWDGRCWPELEEAALRSRLYAFLDRCQNKDGKRISPMTRGDDGVNEILAALRSIAHRDIVRSLPVWLDGANGPPVDKIIVCDNGLFDLSTQTLLPHTPLFFTHTALDYAYDANAPQPVLWLNFLDQIFPSDQQAIETLQEEFGYLITADTSQQKILMWVGDKRSGKGTVARVVKGLIGEDNCASPTLTGLSGTFGLQPLIGKSAAIVGDARLSGRADPGVIIEHLLSLSGEDNPDVPRKNTSDWKGRLKTRFVILTNEVFKLTDASGALASRFIILLFKESFYGREDTKLTDKLLTELPGILNWAIEGWVRLNAREHFIQPQSSQESIEMLESLASPVGAFIREKCDVGPAFSVSKEDLFSAWIAWCVGQRIERFGTKIGFGRDLHAALPKVVTYQPRNAQGKQIESHRGIGIKAPAVATNPQSNLRVVPPAAPPPPHSGAAPAQNRGVFPIIWNKP
jgi:putative DNA primase/helicase